MRARVHAFVLSVFVKTPPGLVLSQWGCCKYIIHLQTGTVGQSAHTEKKEVKTIWPGCDLWSILQKA